MNRQQFEQFAMSEACPLARNGDGYVNARTNTFWSVWKAAVASKPELKPDSFFQEALGELTNSRDLLEELAKDTTSNATGMQNKAVTAYMRARDAVVRLKGRVHG